MIPNTNQLTNFVLTACPKNVVGCYATMFNTSMIQKWLIVSLPKSMIDVTITNVSEIGSNVKEENIADDCVQVKGRHWLDIPSEKLNIKAGYHIYKICFDDNITGIECTMYFAYNIQDDNPEEPYNYMQPIRDAIAEAQEDKSDDTDSDEDEEGDGADA